MATHSQVLKSIKRAAPYLSDAVAKEITAGMYADGLLAVDDADDHIFASAAPVHRIRSINAAMAADPASSVMIKQILAFASHRGVDLPRDRIVDVRELDRALTAKSVPVADRIHLKSCMFQFGLIPA